MDPPVKPDESDCCNSGCNPCILDVYEEQLKKYNKQKILSTHKQTDNCMSPTSYSIFKFIKLEKVSDQAFLFTFEYCRPKKGESKSNLTLQYKPGQHFLMKGNIGDEEFTRAYTPIPTKNDNILKFTVLIKLYEYGRMSNRLRRMRIGTETLWRGPYGEFIINYDVKHVLLIAQGTGIAPIYSIIINIIKNEECYSFLKLFYCCSDCDNIYLREQLYEMCTNWNFTYETFLSKSEGVSAKYNEVIHLKKLGPEEISYYLKDKLENINVLICGSESFTTDIKKYVIDGKVGEKDIFTF